jgi:hypothetical protein
LAISLARRREPLLEIALELAVSKIRYSLKRSGHAAAERRDCPPSGV